MTSYVTPLDNACMLTLHPGKKMAHFKKYWSKSLQVDVEALLQEKVCTYMSLLKLKLTNT